MDLLLYDLGDWLWAGTGVGAGAGVLDVVDVKVLWLVDWLAND